MNNPTPTPQKQKWSTGKKVGVTVATVLVAGGIASAIAGTSDSSSDKAEPAVSAPVKDHADYEAAQQRTPSTYDSAPDIPATHIDQMFVDVLHAEGIGQSIPDHMLIDAGQKTVCADAASTGDFEDMLLIVSGATGFSEIDSGFMIGAAFAAYCPEHAHLIPTT